MNTAAWVGLKVSIFAAMASTTVLQIAMILLYLSRNSIENCTSPTVDFGRVVETGGGAVSNSTYEEGAVLQYECAGGYALVDRQSIIALRSPNIICGSDGSWNPGNVTCSELNCLPPPSIANGYAAPSNSAYLIGLEATYFCNNGYRIEWPDDKDSRASAFCNRNAQWQAVPKCVALGGLLSFSVLVVVVVILAVLLAVSLGILCFSCLWALRMRGELTKGDMAQDEVAYARSHGAFTLNNPIVTSIGKEEEPVGNPLYLTPDEMDEFESKKKHLDGTG